MTHQCAAAHVQFVVSWSVASGLEAGGTVGLVRTGSGTAPRFRQACGLAEREQSPAGTDVSTFRLHDGLPTMGENHRIDPLAATDATPIERGKFVHRLRNHETAATMTVVGVSLPMRDG